jgi:hypothetical protein
MRDDAHGTRLRIRDAAVVAATTTGEQAPRIVVVPIPRVAVGIDEAAAALGLSRDSFRRHVLPDLRVVRVGARRLVRIAELERWAQRIEMVE